MKDFQHPSDHDPLNEDFLGDAGEPTETSATNTADDLHESSEPTEGTVDTIGEVMEVEVLDESGQERSYEVYQEGSLTYFRYYLDDEENGTDYYGMGDREAGISPRPFLSAGAVGVGVLAATFGVGLLVAEMTNRGSEAKVANDDAEQRPIGGKELTAAAKVATTAPEAGKPDWSSPNKTLATKAGSSKTDSLLTAASADKISSAATKLEAQVKTATKPTANPLGAAAMASTWGVSGAATPVGASNPYLAPVASATSAARPNYQVVSMSSLPPISLGQRPGAPGPAAAVAEEQRRLAARMAAIRNANNASIASADVASASTSDPYTLSAAVSPWRPDLPKRTYVADPVQLPPSNVRVQQPEAIAATSTPSYANSGLLAAPETNPVSAAAMQRAEEQKQKLTQAIAKPVAGLLLVSVDGQTPTATQPSLQAQPLPVAPPAPAVQTPVIQPIMEENPTNEDEDLLQAQGIAEPAGLVQSLQQLITLAQSSSSIPKSYPLTQEVAQEALRSSNQLAQFRVLSLNATDYQQLWRMTAQSADRLLAPMHGFVDYQRHVIAVVDGDVNAALPETTTAVALSDSPAIANNLTSGFDFQEDKVQALAQALTPQTGRLVPDDQKL